MRTIPDSEVLDVMVEGGERLCDHALSQWIGDKYKLGEETKQEMIAEWKEKRGRIRELAKRLIL